MVSASKVKQFLEVFGPSTKRSLVDFFGPEARDTIAAMLADGTIVHTDSTYQLVGAQIPDKLEKLLEVTASVYGLKVADIKHRGLRRGMVQEARRVFTWIGRDMGFSNSECGAAIGRNKSNLSRIYGQACQESAAPYFRVKAALIRTRVETAEGHTCPTCFGLGYTDGEYVAPRRDVSHQEMTLHGVFDVMTCGHKRFSRIDGMGMPMNAAKRYCYECD